MTNRGHPETTLEKKIMRTQIMSDAIPAGPHRGG